MHAGISKLLIHDRSDLVCIVLVYYHMLLQNQGPLYMKPSVVMAPEYMLHALFTDDAGRSAHCMTLPYRGIFTIIYAAHTSLPTPSIQLPS